MCRLVALLAVTCINAWATAQTITIAAAVSLKESITAVGETFHQQTGTPVEFAFGASGQLLAQIRSGAPIDVFFSAAPQQMDELQKAGLLSDDTRRDIVTNTLVLIAGPRSKLATFDQLKNESVKHVALGQPQTVPAGAYGQNTLQSLHLFEVVQPKLLFGTNVRQVLDYVISGNADAGLVYGTDALEAGDKVRVVQVAPESSHDPIVYPAAVLKRTSDPEKAKAFVTFLASPAAQQIFSQHGFGPTSTQPSTP